MKQICDDCNCSDRYFIANFLPRDLGEFGASAHGHGDRRQAVDWNAVVEFTGKRTDDRHLGFDLRHRRYNRRFLGGGQSGGSN
jgi:hypothetical protein